MAAAKKFTIVPGVFRGAIITLSLFFLWPENHPEQPLPKPSLVDQHLEKGLVQRDIGPLPSCTGAVTQAASILQLIKEQPGKTDYLITYTTGIDTVSFHCSLTEETIIRIHKWPDDYQKEEIWQKYVLHRLTSAANGGSLNDTPSGKIRGSSKSFYPEQENKTDQQ